AGSTPITTRATASLPVVSWTTGRACLPRAQQTPLEPLPASGDRRNAYRLRATRTHHGQAPKERTAGHLTPSLARPGADAIQQVGTYLATTRTRGTEGLPALLSKHHAWT